MESDVTTRKWAYNPSIGVLGYGAIPYEGRKHYFIIFFYGLCKAVRVRPKPTYIYGDVLK